MTDQDNFDLQLLRLLFIFRLSNPVLSFRLPGQAARPNGVEVV